MRVTLMTVNVHGTHDTHDMHDTPETHDMHDIHDLIVSARKRNTVRNRCNDLQ